MLHLDQRPLPESFDADLAAACKLARTLRASPLYHLIEGVLGFESFGPASFDNFCVRQSILKDFGQEALDAYLAKIPDAMGKDSRMFAQMVADGAWRCSPLATGLFLGSNLIAGETFEYTLFGKYISDLLVRAATGRGRRKLLIEAPYRHSKSTFMQVAVIWYLSQWPHHSTGLFTHTDSFANVQGRTIRNAIEEGTGLKVAGDSSAANQFKIADYDGGFFARGVGGSAQGLGVNFAVCDDLVKDAAMANSAVEREGVWAWLQSTAFSRGQDSPIYCVCGTRWHTDDILGRIRKEFPAEDWERVSFPAIATQDGDELGRKRGDALWPSKRSLAALAEVKSSMSEAWWQAGMMCNPLDDLALNKAFYAFQPAIHVREVDSWYGGYITTTKGLQQGEPFWLGVDANVSPMSATLLVITQHFTELSHLTNYVAVEARAIAEVSLPNSNTVELAEACVERIRKITRGARCVVHLAGDASMGARSAASEKVGDTNWSILVRELSKASNLFALRNHKRSSNPPVAQRIDLVNTLLEKNQLFVAPGCVRLINDLNRLQWKVGLDGSKDVIDKKSDSSLSHASDSASYALWAALKDSRYGECRDMLR
jgi:hypothetical protein